MNTYIKDRREEGFTLIELLIAIVVVGILTAVVIVGIGGLTDDGKAAACSASRDATRAAIAVHKANTGNWVAALTDITTAELDQADVTITATTIVPKATPGNWTITATLFSATGPPVLTCS
jgi:prepilin-type N-terminal cleavage/methylation domain